MLYLVAWIFPALAILLCGKPFQALICLPLTCMFFPDRLWAMLVVSNYYADKRAMMGSRHVAKAIDAQTRMMADLLESHQEAIASRAPVHRIAAPSKPKPIAFEVEADPETREPFDFGGKVRSAWAWISTAAITAWTEAVRAYHNLPEWAQPITWGLAAGTPISVVMVFVLMRR